MAKEPTISLTFIRKCLKDDDTLFPITKEKLEYFSRAIIDSYKQYCQHRNEKAGHKTIEEFAREVIQVHNQKFPSQTNEDKKNYHKQPHYIGKILKDYTSSLVSKNDPSHVFTYVNPQDDARVDYMKEIINGYHQLVKEAPKSDLLKTYLRRLVSQMGSGIRLLSMNHYADSLIIWRSLIESITNYKVLSISDDKTRNLFITRRDDTAKIIGLVTTTKSDLVSISAEIENRKMGKNASWWEKQRFSWAKKIIKGEDPSLKLLMERVNLGKYYPHYQVASLFTHEYLLGHEEFKVISMFDYLTNLYWRSLEEIKEDIQTIFKISEEALASTKKHEENIRKLLKPSRESYNQFTALISE